MSAIRERVWPRTSTSTAKNPNHRVKKPASKLSQLYHAPCSGFTHVAARQQAGLAPARAQRLFTARALSRGHDLSRERAVKGARLPRRHQFRDARFGR